MYISMLFEYYMKLYFYFLKYSLKGADFFGLFFEEIFYIV